VEHRHGQYPAKRRGANLATGGTPRISPETACGEFTGMWQGARIQLGAAGGQLRDQVF
jgi:hypothetical protein